MRRSKRKRGAWRLLAVSASMMILTLSLQSIAAQKRAGADMAEEMQTAQAVTEPETERQTSGEMEVLLAEPEQQTTLICSRDWSWEDSEILLKIAMAEAEGEPTEGKALVMLVVLNRVWSEDFPGTIQEVAFQENQFSVTEPGGRYYTTEPNEDCRKALELVESGWDESQGALYFESCDADNWHSRNLELLFQYGGHRFYR